MFYGCSSLKELNLSNFNTNKVKNMNNMFSGCLSLKNLDIYNFVVNKGANIKDMFTDLSKEVKYKIKDKKLQDKIMRLK